MSTLTAAEIFNVAVQHEDKAKLWAPKVVFSRSGLLQFARDLLTQAKDCETAEHMLKVEMLRNALEQAEMDINVLYMSLNKKDEHFAHTALERIRNALGAS